ncbi:hypothetical protein SB48_HM08orf01925 [Heyndrickxia coagulans]|uniref:Uncharacterized protein n=1 Tax=Heyndrickxia coagulans TaxID=1398 RepID=A0AAN0WAQ2_HEYCO|nr:hypothetical protein SB48_HM08orf01925 [Heyndrickxia coagulans]
MSTLLKSGQKVQTFSFASFRLFHHNGSKSARGNQLGSWR